MIRRSFVLDGLGKRSGFLTRFWWKIFVKSTLLYPSEDKRLVTLYNNENHFQWFGHGFAAILAKLDQACLHLQESAFLHLFVYACLSRYCKTSSEHGDFILVPRARDFCSMSKTYANFPQQKHYFEQCGCLERGLNIFRLLFMSSI